MTPAIPITFILSMFISTACPLKDSQSFFIQSLPLYMLCLISFYLNDDIEDIEKYDEICLSNLDVDEFSVLFSRPSIFSIKHLRSA